MRKACKGGKRTIYEIHHNQNFHDGFMTVINNFTPQLLSIIESQNRLELVRLVRKGGECDSSRLNTKIDTGYASGINLTRKGSVNGESKPQILNRSMEPPFKASKMFMTKLMDLMRDMFKFPRCYEVDDSHKRWAHEFGVGNKVPSLRNTIASCVEAFMVHEDRLNDPRDLMSPVFVFSEIASWDGNWLRHAQIAYGRKSIFDADERSRILSPLISQIVKWHDALPLERRTVGHHLFDQPKDDEGHSYTFIAAPKRWSAFPPTYTEPL